jgi:hypothetical protein
MRFGGGPEEPSFGFEESGLSETERLELMLNLASEIEASAHELSASQINRDPILHTILGKVTESGPNLGPTHLAHLRRIITLRLAGMPDIAAQAARDQEFFQIAIHTVQDEIDELNAIPGADELPDMWDIALEDLLKLEDEE